MLQQLLANQEKANVDLEQMKADRIADREYSKQMMARTDNRERDRENLNEMMAKIRAETDAIRTETKAVHERRMAKLDVHQKWTTANRESTETKPDPGIMQYIEEHQEIAKEDAAVMPVRKPRKRRRICNLAAERRQKKKERTRGNRESRRK
jgi:hypothetical protein